jgi:hypothetical protein
MLLINASVLWKRMQIFFFPEEIIIKSLDHSMKTEIPELKKQFIKFIMAPIFIGLMLFLNAGSFDNDRRGYIVAFLTLIVTNNLEKPIMDFTSIKSIIKYV